jgi:hypothetical protein
VLGESSGGSQIVEATQVVGRSDENDMERMRWCSGAERVRRGQPWVVVIVSAWWLRS